MGDSVSHVAQLRSGASSMHASHVPALSVTSGGVPKGQLKDVVDVGRSLAADRRSKSKTKVKKGQGDRGDVAR